MQEKNKWIDIKGIIKADGGGYKVGIPKRLFDDDMVGKEIVLRIKSEQLSELSDEEKEINSFDGMAKALRNKMKGIYADVFAELAGSNIEYVTSSNIYRFIKIRDTVYDIILRDGHDVRFLFGEHCSNKELIDFMNSLDEVMQHIIIKEVLGNVFNKKMHKLNK